MKLHILDILFGLNIFFGLFLNFVNESQYEEKWFVTYLICWGIYFLITWLLFMRFRLIKILI